MFFYVARQPILTRDKQLFAYELLFRDGLHNVFPNIGPHEATSKLIESSQFNSGIDDLTGGKLAFINFAEEALIAQMPRILPHDNLVVEVLETVVPSNALLQALKTLKQQGYLIALDDFIFSEQWLAVMPMVDIIKVDFQLSNTADILALQRQLSEFNLKYLAEKVETYSEFQMALSLNFDYFQGYFFSRPEIIRKRSLNPSQIVFAELLCETSKSDMDTGKVSASIEKDVSLSYKLLRFVNSAKFHRSRPIENLKQAIVFLGQVELQKLVAIIAAAQLSNDKPSELMRLSITRARFCEHLAHLYGKPEDSSKAFLAGLLSLLDAIMDDDLAHILDRIPLNEDIRLALIERKGTLAYLLAVAKSFEQADWNRTKQLTDRLRISEVELPELYLDALNWANAFEQNEQT